MPTGAGKTITAAQIAISAREKGNVALFLVDRIALADQAVETMRRVGLTTSVIRGAETDIVSGHDVIVASIQTLNRRRHLPDANLLIVDECHILHRAHANILERWSAVPAVGLTATPFAQGLGQYFSRLVVPTSIRELTDDGFLVPVTPYGPAKFNVDGVKSRAGDYAVGDLSAAVNRVEIHADVVSTWKRLSEERSTLVFAVDIAHSKALAASFDAAGVVAEHVDGYTDSEDRQQSIARFKSGQTKVLCSVACLAVGFDAPNASCLVLARSTKSLTMHLQQIGRGLRPFEGKEDCIVIDHAGNIESHGLPADIEIGALDHGSKTWGTTQDKSDPLPKPCSKCAFIKPPRVHECPKCGFAPERQSDVETIDADIVPLTDAALKRNGRRLYQEFLGAAELMGKSRGWAYHLYLEKVGAKPPWSWRNLGAIEPSRESLGFAKHRLIRFMKSRKQGAA
tara:strand:+ start:2347 stop:3711 length:1365 start_codon:yes stop_codon:yes gene_type:complete